MENDGRFYALCDREAIPLFGQSLRQEVREDPEVLGLDAAVEQLDFSAIAARYRPVGAPAYPPGVMFKVLIYGYSIGMRSSRVLARACRKDADFRFLAHGLEPDYRTICRWRREHAAELEALFSQTVQLCQQAGLVSLGEVAIDGSKVRANRSRKALKRAQEFVKTALAEAEIADADIAEGRDEAVTTTRASEETTEECDLMKTTEGVKPAYNAQVAVDAAQQIIVAQQIVTAPGDTDLLPEMVNQVIAECGAAPEKTLADGGYFSQETTLAETTQVYLPPPQTGAARYEWVPEEEAYRCPQGHWLRPGRERDGKQIYRTRRCRGCPHAAECGVSGAAKEIHVLAAAREAMAALRERMRAEAGAAVYAARKYIVEPVFGFFKHNQHFRRFLLRGRTGAGCEWSLLCIGHNLRRWASASRNPVPSAAALALDHRKDTSVGRFFGCFRFYFLPSRN